MTTPLARWWIDEAASGQSPTTIADSTANPLDLTLHADGANPSYEQLSTGRGLRWADEFTSGVASTAVLGGTKLEVSGTQATLAFVADIQPSSNFVPIVGFADDNPGFAAMRFGVMVNGSTLYLISWGGLRTYTCPVGRHHFAFRFHSDEVVDDDRAQLYVDGAPLVPLTSNSIELGANFVVGATMRLCVGNIGSGTDPYSFKGAIYYVEFHATALDAAEIASQAAARLVADDPTIELTVSETEPAHDEALSVEVQVWLSLDETGPAHIESMNAGVLSTGLEYVAEATSCALPIAEATSSVMPLVVDAATRVIANPAASSVVLGS